MKKIFILPAFALAAGLTFGALAGLGGKKEMKAAFAGAPEYQGSIIVQKNDNDMKYTGSKLVAYFFDANSHDGWGDAVQNDGKTYQEYSWTLNFEPTTIVMLRVNGAEWDAGDPWKNIWCRTGDVTLGDDVLWMNGNATDNDGGSGYGTFSLDAVVKGGASDDWSEQTINKKLANVKIGGEGEKIEAYDEVVLPANSYFKVVKGGSEWCGTYTAHSLISSNLSNSQSGNIHNVEAATYEFYFDYEAKTTYITDPVHAAADEWAQAFLSSGCETTKSNWSASATSYAALSDGAKALIADTDHLDHNADPATFIESAVQRYDYVLERYGVNPYNDFMGRVAAGKVTPHALNNLNPIQNVNSTLVVSLVAGLILISATGLFFCLRKRHQA